MPPRIEPRDNGSVSIHRGPLLLALPIGEDWRQIAGDLPHADWEILPTTPWNYALTLPSNELEITERPLTNIPFAPDSAPLAATVTGVTIPGWDLAYNAATAPPASPIETTGESETLTLIPYGATNLRIAQFPVLDT